MATFQVEAVVLRTYNYGEGDKIVALFSRERGKVRAMAKGVAKPKSKKRGLVQPFVHGCFMLGEGRSLDNLRQGEILTSFAGLREDLDKLACGSYLLELTDGFITEGARNENLYFLLLAVLHMLEGGVEPALVLRLFEIRAMHFLGYSPELVNCVSCGQPVTVAPNINIDFSPAMGGVVCPNCRRSVTGLLKCSPGSLRFLERLMDLDLRKIHVLKMSAAMAGELESLLEEYIDYRLEKKIKSRDFMQTIVEP